MCPGRGAKSEKGRCRYLRAHYLGLTPKWVDGTAVGGCSFMIQVRHAAAAIASGPGASTWVAI